jgi:serine/threonine protein kinase
LASSDLIGKTLVNRYFLRELVGSGGMADVYLAWDKKRSAKMAVKVLRRDLSGKATFKTFAQEAEILRKLEHPHIVRLFEFDRDDDLVFIIMEWVDGTNLRKAIADRRSPYTLNEISSILEPVCAALHYAHQNQVYHCDVKPANILISQTGKVLLSDFGIAQLSDSSSSGGTPPYMAPEQFTGDRLDARTDIYSLGVTIYEVLSGGILPFKGESPNSQGSTPQEKIEWEHLNLPIPQLRIYNPTIPEAIQQVILIAMSKDPDCRFVSTQDFLEAFERVRTTIAQPADDAHGTVLKNTIAAGRGLLSNIDQSLSKIPQPSRINPSQPMTSRKNSPVIGRPHLYCRKGDYGGQSISIINDNLSIGRGSHCQVRIAEKSVSRSHSTVLKGRKGIYIRDDNSSLGTYVNGNRITSPVLLKQGDIIQIGYHQIFEFREK